MQFKDAAYQILKEAGEPLHYKDITTKALSANLIKTVGKTPEATMESLLCTDILKPNSRFVKGKKPGTFALKSFYTDSIQQKIDEINVNSRKELMDHVLNLDVQRFEELILRLLEAMGFEETENFGFSINGPADMRGVLRANPLCVVKVAVKAKKWQRTIGPEIVRRLREFLKVIESEQGIIITPSSFSPEAIKEANASARTPIHLINGDQLLDLLIQYHVGVKDEEFTIPVIDLDYWEENLGVNNRKLKTLNSGIKNQTKKPSTKVKIEFPLDIQGNYRGVNYHAKLLSPKGFIDLNGKIYQTPSEAAKTITIYWKSVNGWDFWHYLDPETGKLEKIGTLRNK